MVTAALALDRLGAGARVELDRVGVLIGRELGVEIVLELRLPQ